MINKEYGSDFHYFFDANSSSSSLFNNSDSINLFFSGRVAIYNLLEFGIKKYNWKKVGFPSYYCHDVVEFCSNLPLQIVYYDYNPIINNKVVWEDVEGSVIINVDFFGIRKADVSGFKHTIIIDDITHNILSITNNTADYCFGSLRKQIPVPVGGFCFSNRKDFTTNIATNSFAERITVQKLSAMFLKSEYLDGAFQEKNIYRTLFLDSEGNLTSLQTNSKLPEIAKGCLTSLPIESLIEKTTRNINLIKKKLELPKALSHFTSDVNTDMGLVLICDNLDVKVNLRKYLIENNIYPAVLWPNQVTTENKLLEQKMLFIHVDFRYTETDINFIIDKINNFVENV